MVREVRALGLETCATLGMLTPRAGARAQGRRPRLLQPQPRHLRGVLRRDHHHPHLPGPPRHAAGRARRRPQRLLRRHPRHGRDRARPRAAAAHAGDAARSTRRACRSTSWCRSRARRCDGLPPLDPLDLVRTIAHGAAADAASYVRLSAGRTDMSDAVQALCFLAGANSIFYGERLLTTPNPGRSRDERAVRTARARAGDRPPRSRRRPTLTSAPMSRPSTA